MRSFKEGLVTVLTPCFNGERYLDRYFSAICGQTYENVEVIIVNDERSNDSSEQICFSWKQRIEERGYSFRYILQKKYSGVAGAINEGLPYVSGEFLIWPDCDDTLAPTSIEERVKFLNGHPDYAMVRSDYESVYEEKPDKVVGRGSDWADITNENIFDNLIFENTYVTPGCYMVRSSVLFERIPRGEIYWQNGGGQNWQLLLPCSYNNKVAYIDKPLYKYFIRSDSHSHLIVGDEYLAQKERMLRYQEILHHVIDDFHLLSEGEKTTYHEKIDTKYLYRGLDLALHYNNAEDAESAIKKMQLNGIDPGIPRRLLYHLSRHGLSRKACIGFSAISSLLNKI